MYTIGEVAKKFHISTYTLRYYEKEGIIESIRTEHGERRYDESHIKWIEFVLILRETQMPIAQIKTYAMLAKEGEQTTSKRLHLLKSHLLSIQQQIRMLESTEKMVLKKVDTYEKYLRKNDYHKEK
ncbi:MerR family transcriptional regulator [Fervidibacillus albus]|uniref:MerR family transcriptional regulator n=1 Tax=Fervidibacillus albus TaxID=2980026 RepID=A0A9E8RUZ6_9BACI|nr:MerR family transcriptional regulator [Fervidibacillus albus]WAA08896.1 MerR family transcriptional regulator [Fervidibacillus albus]